MDGRMLKRRTSLVLITAIVFWFAPSRIWPSPHSAGSSPSRLIIQKEGAYAQLLADVGALVLEDYGSFVLVEWPSAPALDDVRATGLRADLLPDPYRIGLSEYPFETSDGVDCAPSVPASMTLRDYERGVTGLYIVQFHGPIKEEWVNAVQRAGGRVVAYLPSDSYIVWMTPEIRDQILQTPMQTGPAGRSPLQWVGLYQPAYRLPSSLLQAAGHTPVSFQVLDVPDGEALARRILSQGKLLQAVSRVGPFLHFKAEVEAESLKSLAFEPTLYRMERWTPPSLMDEPGALNNAGYRVNGEVAGYGTAGVPYLTVLSNLGFDVSGIWNFVVNVTDTGLDKGNRVQNWHFDLYGPDQTTPRVAYVKDWTSDAGGSNDGTDGYGHGTCCAGVAGGYNNNPGTGSGTVSSTGYHFGLGVAPCVRLGGSKVFTFSGSWGLTDSYTSLERYAYANGARISSNSWGENGSNSYNADAAEYDGLVRDASASAGNQEYTIVFAAANSGPDLNTTCPPGTAKNVLTMAAAENWWPSYSTCGWPTCCQDTPGDDILWYSSRGPTSDGRRKPDLAAIANGWNAIRSQYGGSGCGPPFDTADPTMYRSHNGTSAATPAAAGTAALIYQYAMDHWGVPPSPAMIKAILVGTARDLSGSIDANSSSNECLGDVQSHIPNNSQGWGLVNAGKALDSTPKVHVDETALLTATGQTYNKLVTVADGTKPVCVVLAFTDAPGNTSGNAWMNDLNLSVVNNGSVYLGNVLINGVSATGGSADGTNNVEVVLLPAGTTGTLSITVIAANIVADGVPGNGSSLDQDFALFVYNGVECVNAPSGVSVTPSGPLTLCSGGSQLLTASFTGGAGPFTYHWTRDWVEIEGATSSTYTAADSGSHSYNCEVFGSGCAQPVIDPSPTQVTWQAAPIFGGLSSVTCPHSSPCTLNLTWAAATAPCGGVLAYKIYRSTSSPVSPVPANLIATTSGTGFSDSMGLVYPTRYNYIVHAIDTVNSAEDTNAVEKGGVPTGSVTAGTWSEDVESAPQFTGTGLWHVTASSACLSPGFHSATHAYYYGQDGTCTYSTGSTTTGTLTSGSISTISATSSLTFWTALQTENYSGYDRALVQVSANGGITWITIAQDAPEGGIIALSTTWTKYTISLAAYDGQTILLRFVFDSVDSYANGYLGWFLDDIQITDVQSFTSCTTSSSGPRRVPFSVTPTKVVKNDALAANVAVDFDAVNCGSAAYHIICGWGENLASWTTYGTGVCGVAPSTGATNWSSVPDVSGHNFLWFLVVGDNGASTEGSWGLTYPGGAEEGGGSASGACGMTAKDTTASCGTP